MEASVKKKVSLLDKLKSRKFLMALAAFFSSLGVGLLGYFSDYISLAVVGIICSALSAGIYNYCEMKVDAASISSTIETINATASVDNSPKVINDILSK